MNSDPLAPGAQTPKGQRTYDVAAFIWPAYHPDDRAKVFWPDGIGEWQTVISSGPKFEEHDHPRRPLWGYVNEADPYVAEMEINTAADHGVNVFIFDWYWYDGLPFLEGHLNDGFLKARNNDRMKFYLMWANHDVTLGWDKRNADDAFTQKNKSLIWKGAVDREEFEKVEHRWIENYFSHPPYYPHVSAGWDTSPRAHRFIGHVMTHNTPENFEKALRRAKEFVDAHPDQAPLITVNSWNEWTETSYLMPCDRYEYGYLEAVKRVFGSAETKHETL